MSDTSAQNDWRITDRRTAILAALPPALLGLGITLLAVVAGGPYYDVTVWRTNLAMFIGMLPAALIAIGGFIALARKLPAWSYNWLGVNMIGLLLFLALISDDQPYLISPAFDIALILAILLGLLAALVWVARRGWPQSALVSMGLSTTITLAFLFLVMVPPMNRFDLTRLAVLVGLLMSALIYLFVQAGQKTRRILLLALAVVQPLIVWLAVTAMQQHAEIASPYPAVVVLGFGLFLALVMLFGPLLSFFVTRLRRWRLREGRA